MLTLFFFILCYVTVVAYTRQSGSTGLDVATIQKIRHDALSRNSSSSQPLSP